MWDNENNNLNRLRENKKLSFHMRRADLKEISPEMLSKDTLLFFLLFTYNSTGEQDFCSDFNESFGTPLENRTLVGYVIKSLLTRGIFSCNHQCLSLSSCSSYNYYQASTTRGGLCELNGANGNIHQHLVKRHGFVFVLVRRKIKVTKFFLYFLDLACFKNCLHCPRHKSVWITGVICDQP